MQIPYSKVFHFNESTCYPSFYSFGETQTLTEETESDNDLQTAKKMLECSDKLHVLEGQRIVLSPQMNLYALLINTLE